jgi:OHCU decarboxylase
VIALSELNLLPKDEFVHRLAGIFEHSPWVAKRVAAARPFGSREQLLEAMCLAVDEAMPEEQLELIRAHPKLGLRGRERASLTQASAQEQLGAGLEAGLPEDLARLEKLNAAYVEKFSMPFILAVRGHTLESIIAACERRLGNTWSLEKRTALREIGLIAEYRLADSVSETGK